MCGRAYETYTDDELAVRYLNKKPAKFPKLSKTYNLAPSQDTPVVRVVDGTRHIEVFHWQYIPPWEPEFKTKLSTINAKSETVFESRLYRDAILHRRCILPISGFYEWKRDGKFKRPFAIHLKDEPIMSVAGIWDTWKNDDGPERHSFAILTTAANDFMLDIHTRMPVIVDRDNEDKWLDPDLKDPAAIRRMLRPCASQSLDAHEISTLVNSPRNNRPEVLAPKICDT